MNARRLLFLVPILTALAAPRSRAADDAGTTVDAVLSAYGGWARLSTETDFRP